MATYYLDSQQPLNLSDTSLSDDGSNKSTSTFSSLITFLVSFPALNDWLKFVLFGAVLESFRQGIVMLYARVTRFVWISAHFDDNDESYEWLLSWLSKQPSWTEMRDFEISTWSWYDNRTAITLDEDESENHKASRKLSYLPSIYMTYNLVYRNRWVRVHRVQEQTGYYGSKEQTLHVSVMTRDPHFILELLKDAREQFIASQDDKMWIYTSNKENDWDYAGSRDKRSMSSIVLDPGIKDLLLGDARDFLSSKEWYKRRGIPFRRGYLLYGPPGSGKTSIIHAVAGALNLNVYVVSLSRSGLDDTSLGQLINNLPEKCIALMEDIDAAFTHGINRDSVVAPAAETSPTPDKGQPPSTEQSTPSRITLSGLLNALDGVGAKEGRILFATTNRYNSLDAALTRPGRMDLHVEFQNASQHQANALFQEFYLPSNLDGSATPDLEDNEDAEKESVDSGYHSAPRDVVEEVDLLVSRAQELGTSGEVTSIKGTIHTRRVSTALRKPIVAEMASRFADAIPSRECSMASLQGYLMLYKTDPIAAILNAKAWVDKQRLARETKEKEKNKISGSAEGSQAKNSDTKALFSADEVRKLLPLYSLWS